MIQFAGLIILSYLLGAVPFGLVVGRLFGGVDVRQYGSGNMGATNVLRTAGRRAGILVLMLDLGKGAGAVALAWWLVPHSNIAEVAAALAAMVGHNWSVYIRFRGGRGVATGLGGLLMLSWQVALISLAVFLVVVALSRYVSLGSILGACSSLIVMIPFVLVRWEPWEYLIYGLVVAPLITLQHRDNIGRLVAGKERRLGEKAEPRVKGSAE